MVLKGDFAYIKPEFQSQGIKWLGIEDMTKSGGGVFLFLYEDITKPCKYDDWFITLEEALKHAQEYYGVIEDDWETAEELKARGIDITNEK